MDLCAVRVSSATFKTPILALVHFLNRVLKCMASGNTFMSPAWTPRLKYCYHRHCDVRHEHLLAPALFRLRNVQAKFMHWDISTSNNALEGQYAASLQRSQDFHLPWPSPTMRNLKLYTWLIISFCAFPPMRRMMASTYSTMLNSLCSMAFLWNVSKGA